MKRNPNGYGSVTKLKGNRLRPWIAKVTVYDEDGVGKQKAIGYAETEADARVILAKYYDNPWNIDRNSVTLASLFARWKEVKLPQLGEAQQANLPKAYKHMKKYYGMRYRNIRAYQMQDTISNCGYSYSTQANIKNLWGHLDRFAFELDIIDKMYSQLTHSDPVPQTSKVPFTRAEVELLWQHTDDMMCRYALIFCYTGFRLNELIRMKQSDVNLENWTMTGGSKTRAGKDRVVPINDRIKPLIVDLMNGEEYLILNRRGEMFDDANFHLNWKKTLKGLGINKLPHEARHFFRTELDNENGNKKCIDLLMGHTSSDTGNRVYNHKTLEQLRETVNLIK